MAVELTPLRASRRGRATPTRGYVERDGVRVFYEVYGSGEPTVLLVPTWSLVHSRHWKMQIPYFARHCRAWRSTARKRALRPAADERRVRRARVRRRRARGHGRDRDGAGGHGRLSLGAQRTWFSPPSMPTASRAPSSSRRRSRGGQPPYRDSRSTPSTPKGWAKHNSLLLAARLPRLGRVLHRENVHGAAFHEADRGRRRLGPRDGRRDHDRPPDGTDTGGGARDLCRRIRCPVLVIHGDGDAITPLHAGSALAEQTGGELVVLEGSGHCAARARPGQGQPASCASSSRRHARRPLGARQVAPQARALHLLADRPRSRAARRGDRGRAAQAPSGPRDRLARPASRHDRAGGARRADPSRERAAHERVGAHRERVRGARPALLPGDPPHGRDPALELHGLPRPRPRRAVRPLDRRRGVGARLLPAREPRAEARRLCLADRLRRLAADAGRRRPRGVPDCRLQRGDDRAHRPLPAPPRPRALRRQRRRHRPRRFRSRTCR